MLPHILVTLALAGASPDRINFQADDPSAAGQSEEFARSLIDLFVFDQGAPLAGVEMRIGGKSFGATDSTGGLSVRIPSGRQMLTLHRDGQRVVELDLLTDRGELVQILVTLAPGKEPLLDIENSGRSSVLAGERMAEQGDKPKDEVVQQPPGALRGTIVSAEDQKPIVDARIFFSGSTVETQTNSEGQFAVELPAGDYSLSVVHPNYSTQTKDNIRVIPEREVTVSLELTPAGIKLQDYVVTAPYVEGSIASTIEQQRETSAVSEVLGAEQMAAAGDSDAAEALQRVSGLTIEQGKYVLVRGQNYRYTYTLWNGSPLPSPEPLLRVVPLDLFPTGVLSGIEVQKSFTPDRPAEFGGGLINLQTRGIPSDAFVSITMSGGINTFSTFSKGLTYEGGDTDIFGFDDGTRALPNRVIAATNNGASTLEPQNLPRSQINWLGLDFKNNLAVQDTELPPDYGVAFSAGGSIDLPWDGTFGAIVSLKWSNKWRRQRRIERRYEVANAGDDDNFIPELRIATDTIESRTDFNSDIGGLLTLEANWEDHVIQANAFYAHQTQQRTQLEEVDRIISTTQGEELAYQLSWIDRTLIAQQIVGSHAFFDSFFKLEYRGIYAIGIRNSPDRRTYEYLKQEGSDAFFADDNIGLNRRFNEVDDTVVSGGVDLTITPLDPDDYWLGVSVKTGVANSAQDRTVFNRSYQFQPTGQPNGPSLGELNPEILYNPALIGRGLEFIDQSDALRDDSEGFIDVFGAYGMADIRFGDLLRIVSGARYEDASVSVRTFQTDASENARFRQKEWFPSASATVFILEDLQFRGAYARTTSRPNLNELSDARFINPDTGEELLGSPDLRPALIDGVEGRLEWYPTPTESITLGAFWKGYRDPIEQVARSQSGGSGNLFTFQNARRADVIGLEFGGRFEFSHLNAWFDMPEWLEFLDDIYVLGNVAILDSNLQVRNIGADRRTERPLEGQADYTFNIQGGYASEAHDLTIAFNQVGPRLFRAGLAFDIILQEIPSLDITWTWRIWEADSTSGTLRVGASNLIDPELQWFRGGELWRSYRRGRTFGASFKIQFE